jgi:hypothetical protein
MKTKLLLLLCIALSASAQTTFTLEAPASNVTITGLPISPNATSQDAYHRCCFLIHRNEMLPAGVSTINTVSLQVLSGTGSIPVTGNFTLYLQNTNDRIMNKGISWSTIISPMTVAYTGQITIPVNGPAMITIPLNAPFAYAGGGLYVSWDWDSPGPYSTNPAGIACSSGMTALGNNSTVFWTYSANSSSVPQPSINIWMDSRPSLIFGGVSNVTTDLEVIDLQAPGHLPTALNSQTVYSRIANTGTASVNNVTVAFTANGVNNYTSTQVVPTFTPGEIKQLAFTGYNPTLTGISALSVTVLNNDASQANNIKYNNQRVTCDLLSMAPPSQFFFGSQGFWSTGILASRHVIPAISVLKGVEIVIGSFNVTAGQYMNAILADQFGNIIATGISTSITPGATITLPFAANQTLTPGTTYYIGAEQLASNSYPYGVAFAANFSPEEYFEIPPGGGSPTPMYNNYGLYVAMKAVLDHPSPILSVSANTAVCKGAPLTLTASANGTYSWAPVASNNSTVLVTPTTLTDYTVYSTNAFCTDSRVITVNIKQLPAVSIKGTTLACKGGFVTLSVTPSGGTFGGAANSSGQVSSSTPGTFVSSYTVKNNSTGCSNTATLSTSIVNCAGLDGVEADGFEIFPNPSEGVVMVRTATSLSFILYNELGQQVGAYESGQDPAGAITIGPLKPGVYIMVGSDGRAQHVRKLIVK